MGGASLNTATFRFYEELNDFLPAERKKQSFPYRFRDNPSVKDAIEAQGVPHTEVDLIVRSGLDGDGAPIPFSYRLKDGDRIAVYPVFESFDVAGTSLLRPEPLRVVRFVADVHLGKLARLLRQMGFDTWYSNDQSDAEIAMRSKVQNRIVLTRDQGLLKRSIVQRGYWLRSQNPVEQGREVIRRFDLDRLVRPFTRCPACNGELFITSGESVAGSVPPRSLATATRFALCEACGKVYWHGSHARNIESKIRQILQGGPSGAQ